MKLWIRVDAASPDDPRIAQLAGDLRVSVAQALGHAVAVWCAMAEHAPTGDLSSVPPSAIERWADWRGVRGRFAVAFAAVFIAPSGRCLAWGPLASNRCPPRSDRARVSPRLRARVFARDGHRCVNCGATADLQADHITPAVFGGDTVEWNLQTLCRPCNRQKGPQAYASVRGR